MSWSTLARRQAGVITRGQLREHGLTNHRIDHLLETGALEHLTNGVFLARGAPISHRSRVWAAVLATGGIVGFETAANLWGMTDEPPSHVHVVIPHRRRVHIPAGVRVHRVPVPEHACAVLGGLPITARWWTVLDVLGGLRGDAAFRLADRALQQAWITPTDFARRLAEYPGRTGNRMLRLVAGQTADGAAAKSERILHRLLRHDGLTGWVPNFVLKIGDRVVAILDVAFPSARLAIEIDGWAFHSDVERFQRDRHRQNAVTALGWTVLRFTWNDLVNRPRYVLATIHAQLARAS